MEGWFWGGALLNECCCGRVVVVNVVLDGSELLDA